MQIGVQRLLFEISQQDAQTFRRMWRATPVFQLLNVAVKKRILLPRDQIFETVRQRKRRAVRARAPLGLRGGGNGEGLRVVRQQLRGDEFAGVRKKDVVFDFLLNEADGQQRVFALRAGGIDDGVVHIAELLKEAHRPSPSSEADEKLPYRPPNFLGFIGRTKRYSAGSQSSGLGK